MHKIWLVALLTLSVSACVTQPKTTPQHFSDETIGLSFQYPPTWKVIEREIYVNDNYFMLSRPFKNDVITRNYFMVVDVIPLKKVCSRKNIERRINYTNKLDLGAKIDVTDNDQPLPSNASIRNYSQATKLNSGISKAYYYNYCHNNFLVEVGLSRPDDSIADEFYFILDSIVIANSMQNN